MSKPVAYSVFRDFAPAKKQIFCVDRHYLLYAASGAMRLETERQSWALRPARAALITAHHPIEITLPQRMTASCVLFSPDFTPKPPSALTVFDISPLARELIRECRAWDEAAVLDAHAILLFKTLADVTWRLAHHPSCAVMPAGQSKTVQRALALTQARLASTPTFVEIAAEVAMTPRSLARHFSSELGMTWQMALRKMRIIRAIELLAENDITITQIAFCVGYNSLSGFNAAFRDFTGQTPSQYRASFHP